MKPRKVQQIEEMPLLMETKHCARLLGMTSQHFGKFRRRNHWPPPFNRYGRPQWHREAVMAYLRGDHTEQVA